MSLPLSKGAHGPMTHNRDDAGGEHVAYQTRNEWVEQQRTASSPTRTMPRALRLTALSAVLPGSGLIATRARWVGVLLATLALGSAAAVAFFVWRDGLTSTALATAANEDRLRTILWILVAGTAVWIVAIACTALTTRPQQSTPLQRAGLATFTGLLCLLVSAPAALGVQYISSHVAAMDKVFTQQKPAPGQPTPTSSLSQDSTDPWADLPRVNTLLLGSDAAEAREGTRTDTMIILSTDTHTGDSVLFSIPRNLQRVPIPRDLPLYDHYPDGYNCGDQCLMNAIWTEAELDAENRPEKYTGDPTPGLTATREVLSTILGLPIQHTVIVNLKGFEELIDAMGGVEINVQEPIPINGRTYTDAEGHLQLDPNSPQLEWLQPGPQRLTGHQALGYSRSRVTTDDFSRMRRQRCMVGAVIDQADPLTLLQRYPQIITAVGNNVVTDVPQDELGVWADLVLRVQRATIRSLPFTTSNTDVFDPNYSEIRSRVWAALHVTPKPKPKPADDAAQTTAPAVTATPTEEPTDAEATTTEPTDELEEIGTVCD